MGAFGPAEWDTTSSDDSSDESYVIRHSQGGREPLAALHQQQISAAAGHAVAPPAAGTRVRKSMSSQLEQQSNAAQLTRRPKLAPLPASPVPDIDSCDANDPLTAASYVSDIYAYHRRTEANFRPLPTYMSRQVSTLACLRSATSGG